MRRRLVQTPAWLLLLPLLASCASNAPPPERHAWVCAAQAIEVRPAGYELQEPDPPSDAVAALVEHVRRELGYTPC